jgi:hypothetical protein
MLINSVLHNYKILAHNTKILERNKKLTISLFSKNCWIFMPESRFGASTPHQKDLFMFPDFGDELTIYICALAI